LVAGEVARRFAAVDTADVQVDATAPGRLQVADAVVGYLLAVVLSSIGASIALGAGLDEDGFGVLLAGQVGFWIGLLVVVAFAVRVRAAGAVRDVLAVRATGRDVAVGLPLGLITQLVVLPLLYLPLQALVDDLDVEGPARELLDRGSGPAFVLLVLSVVVVAPFVEELFFRGLLLRSMEQRWGTKVAVIGSSVIFGATHFQAIQFPALALAGLLFAVLAVRSGRLGPAVAAHVGFNAATVVVLTFFD
jgi:membrane protease YdiL (CAAX protease family)